MNKRRCESISLRLYDALKVRDLSTRHRLISTWDQKWEVCKMEKDRTKENVPKVENLL